MLGGGNLHGAGELCPIFFEVHGPRYIFYKLRILREIIPHKVIVDQISNSSSFVNSINFMVDILTNLKKQKSIVSTDVNQKINRKAKY